jgi:NDP-sugar pyrophosphorylase family protein
MKAFILAAGKGMRLRPLTHFIPKVMIPILGKPVLEHHVEQLADAGIREIIINLHHLPEKIQEYFGDGEKWGVRIQYSYEAEILGTSGGVKSMEKCLESEEFLVVYGDNVLEMKYREFISFSKQKEGIGTVAVFEKADVRASGILDIAEDMRIRRFKEKPREHEMFSHWVNAGVYSLSPQIFQYIPPGFSDFGWHVLPAVLAAGERLYAFRMEKPVRAIDSPELLEKIKEFGC